MPITQETVSLELATMDQILEQFETRGMPYIFYCLGEPNNRAHETILAAHDDMNKQQVLWMLDKAAQFVDSLPDE